LAHPVYLPSLVVLIARAVFLLEHGQSDGGVPEATDQRTEAPVIASVMSNVTTRGRNSSSSQQCAISCQSVSHEAPCNQPALTKKLLML